MALRERMQKFETKHGAVSWSQVCAEGIPSYLDKEAGSETRQRKGERLAGTLRDVIREVQELSGNKGSPAKAGRKPGG